MSEGKNQIKKVRKLKCTMCKQLFDKEELTLKSGKKYCKNCLIKRQEQIDKNKSDWDLLFQYICELYKIKVPTGFMFVQLKKYRNEYNYTDIGMYYTLKYYYDILESTLKEDIGLGIIPYYYERAKKYYNKIFDLEDIAEEFVDNGSNVVIKTSIINKRMNIKKPLPLNIDWEGDNADN